MRYCCRSTLSLLAWKNIDSVSVTPALASDNRRKFTSKGHFSLTRMLPYSVCVVVVLVTTTLLSSCYSFIYSYNRIVIRKPLCANGNHNNNIPQSDSERMSNIASSIAKYGSISIAASLSSLFIASPSEAANGAIPGMQLPKKANRPKVYTVEYTNPPCLQPRTKQGEQALVDLLASSSIVLIGSKINAEEDNELETLITSRLLAACNNRKKKVSVGFATISRSSVDSSPIVQSGFDEYINSGKTGIKLEDADSILSSILERNGVSVSFNRYRLLFHFCRKNSVAMVALGADDAVVKKVQQNGLEALSEEDKSKYVPDLEGFLSSIRTPGFSTYADRVIFPAYGKFVNDTSISVKGLTPENYFSFRILQDEAIASKAAEVVGDGSNSMMVVIADKEQSIYGFGLQGRFKRYLAMYNKDEKDAIASNDASTKKKGIDNVYSILVNPTATDTLSKTLQLQLTLQYGDKYLREAYPVCNVLWFDKSPTVKLLTRVKNPINNNESTEKSIIGAF